MSQATSYDKLKDAISRVYPDLPGQLQRIARFALERPNEFALGTVAVIAEAVQVQPSSLIRFANALEYKGFSEMQQVFRGNLVERSTSYRERIDQLRRQDRPGSNGGSLHQFVGEAIAELGNLEETVRAADVMAAVKLMCGADRVYVLAQRRAFPVACYLSYALSHLDIKAYLLDGTGGMLNEALKNITSRDALIVTSFRSYSQPVIDAAGLAHEHGVPVIAITDSALSPLKPYARVSFEVGSTVDQPFRSLVAPLCLAQALVVTAGHHLAEASVKSAPAGKSRSQVRPSKATGNGVAA